jgi:hypothetical protein
VQNNPNRIRWDLFVTHNTKGALPSRPSIIKTRQKALPPVRSSILTQKPSQLSDRKTLTKPPTLPPIDVSKKSSQNLPIMFILSKLTYSKNKTTKKNHFLLGSSNSTKLCSQLMERYNEITYLLIEDIANIDYNDHIGKIYFSN